MKDSLEDFGVKDVGEINPAIMPTYIRRLVNFVNVLSKRVEYLERINASAVLPKEFQPEPMQSPCKNTICDQWKNCIEKHECLYQTSNEQATR